MFAVMSGETDKIRQSIAADKNVVTLRDKLGRTLLMEAAIFKREDIAKLLIENGADVNTKEVKGWTALHFAIQSYLPDLVKLLISKGADVNARTHYDNTPLHEATMTIPKDTKINKVFPDIISILLFYQFFVIFYRINNWDYPRIISEMKG
jgi:ankyrin repeat protein